MSQVVSTPALKPPLCDACGGSGIYDAAGQDRNCKHCRGHGIQTKRRAHHIRPSVVVPAVAIAHVPVQPVLLPLIPTCSGCHKPTAELFQIVDESGKPWRKEEVCQACGEKFIAYYTKKAPSAANTQSL